MAEHEVYIVELQALERAINGMTQILAVERVFTVGTLGNSPVEFGGNNIGFSLPAEAA